MVYQELSVSVSKQGINLRPTQDHSDNGLNIAFGNASISTRSTTALHDHEIDVFGIAGILDLGSVKYLLLISGREEVAQIDGNHVYAITNITPIPLSSREEALKALSDIKQTTKSIDQQDGYETDDSDHVEDEVRRSVDLKDEHHTQSPASSTAATITQKTAALGTFAQKWFARSTNSSSLQHVQKSDIVQPITNKDDDIDKAKSNDIPTTDTVKEEVSRKTTINTYSKRILRNVKLYYSSKSFFFSYEHNLSVRWSHQASLSRTKPLHEQFEHEYFWNRHLVEPFLLAGQHQYILPLMQGFVGQKSFSVGKSSISEREEPKDQEQQNYLVTLISRRSIKRAGLRYLRRGIDGDGNVANCVETEQIFCTDKWDQKIFSLVQLRGSIPLFFSQSPYSFKPLPELFGSQTTNQEAFKAHFDKLKERYGKIQVASLVDKHATEASIGEAYEKTAAWLNDSEQASLGFEWFDFHKECKGMKFENVSVLIDSLQAVLKSFSWTVRSTTVSQDQTGILRTNCMDCLDRTNVTQSAIGGWVLQQQLNDLGLGIDLQKDASSIWFNQLWADNGDAISRQYAGTAALKGDFTRTRKRNWTGAISDFSLTLNRYYNNIFGDYFLQTCIDYLLGNVGIEVWDDFETSMMSQDHALDIQRIRRNAIDVCVKIVLEDPKEKLLGGWTLSCPSKANTLRSMPFEECVLLLTQEALYFCRFDWSTEKVGSFERVCLVDLVDIWRGVYITSTLGTSSTDEEKNVGFAFHYNTRGTALIRTNTRSLENEKTADDQNVGRTELEKQAEPHKDNRRLLAFKMLHSDAAASKHDDDVYNESQLAAKISKAIADATATAMKKDRGLDDETDGIMTVEEKSIISLADAKKSTGYVESLGYSLKKLVW